MAHVNIVIEEKSYGISNTVGTMGMKLCSFGVDKNVLVLNTRACTHCVTKFMQKKNTIFIVVVMEEPVYIWCYHKIPQVTLCANNSKVEKC